MKDRMYEYKGVEYFRDEQSMSWHLILTDRDLAMSRVDVPGVIEAMRLAEKLREAHSILACAAVNIQKVVAS